MSNDLLHTKKKWRIDINIEAEVNLKVEINMIVL